MLRLAGGTHEGHHDLDVGQPHLVTHALEGAAFQIEAVAEGIGHVARGATEAQHRVLFARLVHLAADQVLVLIGLEVRHAHDDLLRMEGGRQGGDTLDQLVDVEVDRACVAGGARIDGLL